jgi:chaperone LolA
MFLFALSAIASDIDNNVDIIVKKVQDKYSTINTLSAKFTQVSYYKSVNQSMKSNGLLYLKKPGKLRWSFLQPEQDELVSNGETFWMYQSELAQVVETTAADGAPPMALRFLTGMGELTDDFTISLQGETTEAYELLLIPKTSTESAKRIILEASKKDFIIISIAVEDNFGTKTTIKLSEIKVNEEIEDSFFDYVPPRGVRVVSP